MTDDTHTPTPETADAPETPDAPETADAQTPDAEQDEKLAQSVNIEDAGPARKKITIEIPHERIAETIEESYKELRHEATLPGFRRGRAPQRLIEKRFGEDVRNEAKSKIIGESFQQVVEDESLKMIGEPDIKDVDKLELPETGPLKFEVEVEVTPQFELPDLKGLEVTKTTAEVTDAQVDAELNRYREMQGSMQSIDGAAEAGDYAVADVEVLLADGEVAESRRGANLRVPDPQGPTQGRGQVAGILVPDLHKHLLDAKAGDAVTIEATGPKGHENPKLQDAKLTLEVKINQVQRMTPIQMSQLVEMSGFDSEQELRDQVKFNLDRRATQEAEQSMRKQVTDAILEKIDFDLPQDLSGRQTERVLQRRAMEMMYSGASEQDIEQAQAEMRAASAEEAQRELKLFFILNKAAEEFDVEVGEAEINGRIAQMAMQQNRRPEKLKQEMARSGRIDQLYVQLREEKVVDKLLEAANVKEVTPEDAGADEKPDGDKAE